MTAHRQHGPRDWRTSGRPQGYSAPLTAEHVRRRWLRIPLVAALARTVLPILLAIAALATFAVPMIAKVL